MDAFARTRRSEGASLASQVKAWLIADRYVNELLVRGRLAAQLAEQRSTYRDLAERRQEFERDRSYVPTAPYRDQSERRAGSENAVGGEPPYRDQAERRTGADRSVGLSTYRDQADRHHSIDGNR